MPEEVRTAKEGFYLLLTIFFIGVVIDIFFIKYALSWASDARLLGLVAFWLLICKILHFTSIATLKFIISLFAIFSFLFVFFSGQPMVERAASWMFVFLAVGVIQQFWETRKTAVKNVQ